MRLLLYGIGGSFSFRAFAGQRHESLDDTLDDEIIEFLFVTAQSDRMQSRGDYAVAVVAGLAIAEVVAAANCVDLFGLCSPYRVITPHTDILLISRVTVPRDCGKFWYSAM